MKNKKRNILLIGVMLFFCLFGYVSMSGVSDRYEEPSGIPEKLILQDFSYKKVQFEIMEVHESGIVGWAEDEFGQRKMLFIDFKESLEKDSLTVNPFYDQFRDQQFVMVDGQEKKFTVLVRPEMTAQKAIEEGQVSGNKAQVLQRLIENYLATTYYAEGSYRSIEVVE